MRGRCWPGLAPPLGPSSLCALLTGPPQARPRGRSGPHASDCPSPSTTGWCGVPARREGPCACCCGRRRATGRCDPGAVKDEKPFRPPMGGGTGCRCPRGTGSGPRGEPGARRALRPRYVGTRDSVPPGQEPRGQSLRSSLAPPQLSARARTAPSSPQLSGSLGPPRPPRAPDAGAHFKVSSESVKHTLKNVLSLLKDEGSKDQRL